MQTKTKKPTKEQIETLSEILKILAKSEIYIEYFDVNTCVTIYPYVIKEGKRCMDDTFSEKPNKRLLKLLLSLVGKDKEEECDPDDYISYLDPDHFPELKRLLS